MIAARTQPPGARNFETSSDCWKPRRSPLRGVFAITMVFLGVVSMGTALLGGYDLADEPLSIETATGPHEFLVEVARSPAMQARGLMYRTSMSPSHGMLFVFRQEGPLLMWMKNTVLPLDMIFLSRTGTVVDIHEHAVPFSEQVISSSVAAKAVLEVYAGTAARIGVRRGALVRHPAFEGS